MTVDDVRPSWDSVWMRVAHIVAERSIDPRTKVGCIVVSADNQQVLALGYNGMERGGSNEVDSAEPGMSGTIHAELNSLIKLDVNFPKGKVMYLTLSPCKQCARAIVNAGVEEVIYEMEYRDPSGLDILRERGVKVRMCDLGTRQR